MNLIKELNEAAKTFDDWVELTVLAAEQNEEEATKVVQSADDASMALDNFAKLKAKQVGVPKELINKVALKASDKIKV
jgi:hypothetical protein